MDRLMRPMSINSTKDDHYAQPNSVSLAVSSGDVDMYYRVTVDASFRASFHVPDVKEASVVSSIFNLSNTILGASTLSVAYACRNMGILPFVVLLTVFGLLAEFSIRLLTRSMVYSGKDTYGNLGLEAFGRAGEMVALLSVIVQQLGGCVTYVDILADAIRPAITGISPDSIFSKPAPWQILIMIVIVFPLTMLKKMDSLKWSSFAAVACIVLFATLVTIDSLYHISEINLHESLASGSLNLFGKDAIHALEVLPTLCFAYVCHMNVFPIYQELKDSSIERMGQVSRGSVTTCFVVYMAAGFIGYLGFQTEVQEDFLTTFNMHSFLIPHIIVRVLRICFGVALVFSYPVLAFELRHCVDDMMFPHSTFTWTRHTLMNVCVVVFTTLVALLVPSIETVFSFIGATTSTLIVFILPAAFYLRIDRQYEKNEIVATQGKFGRSMRRCMAYLMLVLGCILTPVCVTAKILSLV